MLRYSPTPIQEIHDSILDNAGVRLLIKREDLNHPLVSGNKWWKLKYNLEEALKLGHRTLLTFGGAYSNHIFATAAAAYELGLKSIGVIRGEETLPLNDVLSFAVRKGMQLHYVSRDLYRKKNETHFIHNLRQTFGDFYLIPEGGTNELAVRGVTEFAQTLGNDFDYLCCAVGTGGTMAGLINGVAPTKKLIGLPVLKNGAFLKDEIENLLSHKYDNWTLNNDYHFGGYGKVTPELLVFVGEFLYNHSIAIDTVYTGKAMAGVFDLIGRGFFPRGSRILFIHTGGVH